MATKFPNEYDAPEWVQLYFEEAEAAGIPSDLLYRIAVYGEKSNADQVSSAGARTPLQIIPATRDLALKRWGIDAYASPRAACKVAALLLKDALDRNDGNEAAAIAEYHGGADKANWGPKTKSYVQRVSNGAVPVDVPTGSPRTDTLDQGALHNVFGAQPAGHTDDYRLRLQQQLQQLNAMRQQQQAAQAAELQALGQQYADTPVGGQMMQLGSAAASQPPAPVAATEPQPMPQPMPQVEGLDPAAYEAYKSGQLSPEAAAAFERLMGPGQQATPQVEGLDPAAYEAYKSGQLSPEASAAFERLMGVQPQERQTPQWRTFLDAPDKRDAVERGIAAAANIGAGAASALPKLGSALAGVANWGLENMGFDEAAMHARGVGAGFDAVAEAAHNMMDDDFTKSARKALSEALNDDSATWRDVRDILAKAPSLAASEAFEMLGQMVGPAALGALMKGAGQAVKLKGPALKLAQALGLAVGEGAMEGGGRYTELREEGKSMEEANTRGLANAAWAGATSLAFGGAGEGALANRLGSLARKQAGKEATKTSLRETIKTGAKEFGEEFVQEGGNPLSENVAMNEELDWEAAKKQGFYGGVVGGVSGGLVHPVMDAINDAGKPNKRRTLTDDEASNIADAAQDAGFSDEQIAAAISAANTAKQFGIDLPLSHALGAEELISLHDTLANSGNVPELQDLLDKNRRAASEWLTQMSSERTGEETGQAIRSTLYEIFTGLDKPKAGKQPESTVGDLVDMGLVSTSGEIIAPPKHIGLVMGALKSAGALLEDGTADMDMLDQPIGGKVAGAMRKAGILGLNPEDQAVSDASDAPKISNGAIQLARQLVDMEPHKIVNAVLNLGGERVGQLLEAAGPHADKLRNELAGALFKGLANKATTGKGDLMPVQFAGMLRKLDDSGLLDRLLGDDALGLRDFHKAVLAMNTMSKAPNIKNSGIIGKLTPAFRGLSAKWALSRPMQHLFLKLGLNAASLALNTEIVKALTADPTAENIKALQKFLISGQKPAKLAREIVRNKLGGADDAETVVRDSRRPDFEHEAFTTPTSMGEAVEPVDYGHEAMRESSEYTGQSPADQDLGQNLGTSDYDPEAQYAELERAIAEPKPGPQAGASKPLPRKPRGKGQDPWSTRGKPVKRPHKPNGRRLGGLASAINRHMSTIVRNAMAGITRPKSLVDANQFSGGMGLQLVYENDDENGNPLFRPESSVLYGFTVRMPPAAARDQLSARDPATNYPALATLHKTYAPQNTGITVENLLKEIGKKLGKYNAMLALRDAGFSLYVNQGDYYVLDPGILEYADGDKAYYDAAVGMYPALPVEELIAWANKTDKRTSDTAYWSPAPNMSDYADIVKLAKDVFGITVVPAVRPNGDGLGGQAIMNSSGKHVLLINVAANEDSPAMATFGHELWHFIKFYHPDLAKIVEDVFDKAKNQKGLDAYLDAEGIRNAYKQDEHTEEVLGDHLGDLMCNEKFIAALQAASPQKFNGFATVILGWLKRTGARIKQLIKSRQAWRFGKSSQYIDRWDDMVNAMTQAVSEAAKRGVPHARKGLKTKPKPKVSNKVREKDKFNHADTETVVHTTPAKAPYGGYLDTKTFANSGAGGQSFGGGLYTSTSKHLNDKYYGYLGLADRASLFNATYATSNSAVPEAAAATLIDNLAYIAWDQMSDAEKDLYNSAHVLAAAVNQALWEASKDLELAVKGSKKTYAYGEAAKIALKALGEQSAHSLRADLNIMSVAVSDLSDEASQLMYNGAGIREIRAAMDKALRKGGLEAKIVAKALRTYLLACDLIRIGEAPLPLRPASNSSQYRLRIPHSKYMLDHQAPLGEQNDYVKKALVKLANKLRGGEIKAKWLQGYDKQEFESSLRMLGEEILSDLKYPKIRRTTGLDLVRELEAILGEDLKAQYEALGYSKETTRPGSGKTKDKDGRPYKPWALHSHGDQLSIQDLLYDVGLKGYKHYGRQDQNVRIVFKPEKEAKVLGTTREDAENPAFGSTEAHLKSRIKQYKAAPKFTEPRIEAAIEDFNKQWAANRMKGGLAPAKDAHTWQKVKSLYETLFDMDVQPVVPKDLESAVLIKTPAFHSGGDIVFVNMLHNNNFSALCGAAVWQHIKKKRPELAEWYEDLFFENAEPSARTTNFVGDSFMDPVFLKKLARADESKFKHLMNTIIDWIKNMHVKLKGFDSYKKVNDINAMHNYLVMVMQAYTSGKDISEIKPFRGGKKWQ